MLFTAALLWWLLIHQWAKNSLNVFLELSHIAFWIIEEAVFGTMLWGQNIAQWIHRLAVLKYIALHNGLCTFHWPWLMCDRNNSNLLFWGSGRSPLYCWQLTVGYLILKLQFSVLELSTWLTVFFMKWLSAITETHYCKTFALYFESPLFWEFCEKVQICKIKRLLEIIDITE